MKKFLFAALSLALLGSQGLFAKDYDLKSPDGTLAVKISTGTEVTYSVTSGETLLLTNSPISMTLTDGTILGGADKVKKVTIRTVNETHTAAVYKKSTVKDHFNEIKIAFKDYDIIFRAYDEGVAYRFVTRKKADFNVASEQAEFKFADDWQLYVPYVRQHTQTLETQYWNSFENNYDHHKLSEWNKERIAFLPITVEAANGLKVCITETDLLDYPGMFLYNSDANATLEGRFAPVPDEVEQGGHNRLQGIVKTRKDYIAESKGASSFPWRIVMVSKNDIDLANADMVWNLATPADPAVDYSWVKPGKVAWDWWNDWNIYGVDFRAGINNETYKYYIDFASEHGIEYVILDEGWAVNLQADLMQIIPEIDLPMLGKYAASKNVGLILWAGYWAFNRDIEGVCKHYSEMEGFKGFKIDFMDRDDQPMVQFYHDAARIGAKYHMLVDFHGAFKPNGLHRTYPNVIGFEGVAGMENLKWDQPDQVTYDVILPYTRMVAGPMDYTQGAMRNATRYNYRPVNSEGMSQGTRCHQLAEYVIFESPLNMLCDSPSNYIGEPECTKYIAECPTVWDETVALDGKIGVYAVIARRSGDTWYVGAINGWDPMDLDIDLSFLPDGNWTVELFRDGINADRAARDYKKEVITLPASKKINAHLAPGGGWTAKITRK